MRQSKNNHSKTLIHKNTLIVVTDTSSKLASLYGSCIQSQSWLNEMRTTLNQIKTSENNKFSQVFDHLQQVTTQIRGE
jgi:hypothetical protein